MVFGEWVELFACATVGALFIALLVRSRGWLQQLSDIKKIVVIIPLIILGPTSIIFTAGTVRYFLPYWPSECQLESNVPPVWEGYDGEHPLLRIDKDNKHRIIFIPIDKTKIILRPNPDNYAYVSFYLNDFFLNASEAIIYVPTKELQSDWEKQIDRAQKLRYGYLVTHK